MSRDDAPPFESREVTRLHLPSEVRLLPFVALFPQIPRLLERLLDLDPATAGVVQLGTLAALAVAVFFGLKRLNDRNAETGSVRAASEGVHWNGELILSRERITAGVVLPDAPGGTRVRFARKFRAPIEFGVANVDEGRDMLRALGLDASQVTATFRVRSPLATSKLSTVGLFVLLFGVMMATVAFRLPSIAMFLPVILFALAFAWPQKAVVGTDGVLVNWLFRRRFVPYTELARLEDTETGLVLVTRAEERIPLEFNTQRGSKSYRIRAQAERDSLRSRIEQAKAAAPEAAPALDPDVVARGERDVVSWLAALRSMAHREGGMRTAPVLREQLFAMLANTRLAATVRAGAAAALGLDAAPAERERLRETAASIASPRVRVVVEAAARGDADKIAAALDDVRDEHVEKRAAG